MTNNEQHINEILKQKFESFAPKPPEHVWEGIAAALDKEAAPVWYNTLVAKISAALLLMALLLGGYWIINKHSLQKNTIPVEVAGNNKQAAENGNLKTNKANQPVPTDSISITNEVAAIADEKEVQQISQTLTTRDKKAGKASASYTGSKIPVSTITNNSSENSNVVNSSSGTNLTQAYMGAGKIETMESKSVDPANLGLPEEITKQQNNDVASNARSGKKQPGHWALGFYFTPEKVFDPFDSVTLQNSYKLSIEPVYYINKHWFIRPALGVQYSRDKGFVKADYLSWDHMGSYEDVVEVTFDSTGNTVVPVYHTQRVEVFDSIRRITISEETNRYLYLQTSVVFGYHNHTGKFGWSVYTGTGINFILMSKQDNPVDENASVIELNYNLPKRRSPQYHIKLGLGLDYTIGKNWLVSVEPEYLYYINGLNAGGIYSNPLSGMSIRFGFIYTIK